MHISVYSIQAHEIPYFEALKGEHTLDLIPKKLDLDTIDMLKEGSALCCFVTDRLDRVMLEKLKAKKVRLIALRSAGFDHVDLSAAKALGLSVVRVPAYSPHSVAEFAVGLMLSVTRKIVQACDRVRQHNFSLEGQCGFNLRGKTIGIIGTGHIGSVVAKILSGFDGKLLACDPFPNEVCRKLDVSYASQETLFQACDIITLHCPLSDQTRYIINKKAIALMKSSVVIINTGRGALIDTQAMIQALKQGKIGGLGLDVYEHEHALFFQDRSDEIILDDTFICLQAFPQVLITGHQAFLSNEAVENIVKTSLENIRCFEKGVLQNEVSCL